MGSFVNVNDETSFINGCVLILMFEIFLMEPFRTLLKLIGHLIVKDLRT
jgi:hypothetical protein